MEKYVCAFRGRRDSYQVPLALAESHRLEDFITDFYVSPELSKKASGRLFHAKWFEKVLKRSEPGLPLSRVRCLWGTTLIEHLRTQLGYSPGASFAWYDEIYSRAAAARANHTKANLFLYSPYAWEAFADTAYRRHAPRKVLFQFHPHPDYERRVLAEDFQRYPAVRQSYVEATNHDLSPRVHQRQAECWRHADLIFCASTFTQATLLAAGADRARCRVIPYGVAPSEAAPPSSSELEAQTRDGRFRALFVGSGVQRKGLHHLLVAWRTAHLPPGSELTLVCRHIDPGLEAAVAASPATVLRRHVSAEDLREMYRKSSAFVMPSLIEGFGQVFLEALIEGCPVLGTVNTCLPDVGGEEQGVFTVDVGNIEALHSQLERLAGMLPNKPAIREAARERAREFCWSRFRQGINAGLSESKIK